MAKQVKPFEVPICLGYTAWVRCEEFSDCEGVVYFDDEPKLGDTAILSDGKEYKVVRKSDSNMNVTFDREE